MSEIEVQNPYNLESIARLRLQNEEEVLKSLEKAFELAQDRRRLLPKYKRLQILDRTHKLLAAKREELIQTAVKEGGKPYVDSAVEVDRALLGVRLAIKELEELSGREIPMGLTQSSEGRTAYTERIPRGVVVAISAFNHPLNLIVHQVIPAVAVGCPVLVKPASTTPLSCQLLVDALYEAGLPKDWCQMLICENAVAEKLATDRRVSFLSFIGSSKVGWHLRSKLSPGATCALEHGGAAPAIIDESAQIDDALPLLVKAGYYHAGQVCVSLQRIFIHEAICDSFVEKFVPLVDNLTTADPMSESTDCGPLILPKEVGRVQDWVKEASKEGAQVLCGGKKISETCFEPTVLLNPSENSKVSTEEIFGPVTCIYKFSDLDKAIDLANKPSFAFQASVFSTDLQKSRYCVERFEARTVMVNDHTAFRTDWMPFGGYKNSGLGVGGIKYTMHDMSIEKMTVTRYY